MACLCDFLLQQKLNFNFPFFYQEAICSSLEDYNKQIEQLKQEMNDATRGADNIRNDISALSQRYAVIDRDEDCGVLIFITLCFLLTE